MSQPEGVPLFDDGDRDRTQTGATLRPVLGRTRSGAGAAPAQTSLQPGTILADRYEILALLGEGGMGSVYKAHDRELDRTVALKTILPEMAGNPDMLARFKHEVLLASRITHRNVVRLYDLGESQGLKFLTMEYISGEDLHALLRREKRLPPARAVPIIQQVCLALEAAHAQGVVHRDLKPHNIMLENGQYDTTSVDPARVVVMDFGLARATQDSGMTQTGALVGTMDYMSPEQALGELVEARSDIFAVGLILYEMLTGIMPFRAESAIASLVKRSRERARPASDVDVSIPRPLSNVVAKCLEREPQMRFQNARELILALDSWTLPTSRLADVRDRLRKPSRNRVGLYGVVALLLLAAAVAVGVRYYASARQAATSPSPVSGPVLSVAFVPLRNVSSDPKVQWLGASIAEMLATDLGQSPQLRTVPPDRMHQVMRDLRLSPDAEFDSATLSRLANFSNADVVVSGQYTMLGDRIRLDLRLQNLKDGRAVPVRVEAANESELMATVDEAAKSIRSSLALSPDVVKDLQASAFKPSTSSIEALRAYDEGLDHLRRGNNMGARKAFEAATARDSKFALAYSRLGHALAALGYGDEAEVASRRAVEMSEPLPAAEKYRIIAEHAVITKDYPHAIAAYRKLTNAAPEDVSLQMALAQTYEEMRDLDQARAAYERILRSDPKYVDALLGVGRVHLLRGDSQASLDPLTQAYGLATQFDNEEQKSAALFCLGTAYAMLGRTSEAKRNFEDSLAISRGRGDKGTTAKTLNSLARLEQAGGNFPKALQQYQEAFALRRDIADKKGLANTLLDLGTLYESRGDYGRALEVTKQSLQLQREAGDPLNQATCLNNIGWYYLEAADYENATTYFQQALDIREKLNDPAAIADTVYNLAETSVKLGHYEQAIKHYLRAADLWRSADDRHGAALASFGLGNLFSYQGRYGAALDAQKDAFKLFRQIDEKGIWPAQAQASLGAMFAATGRDIDATKQLDEALASAKGLNNDAALARFLNLQGERLLYRGDSKAARTTFELAFSTAKRARSREEALIAEVNLARVAVADGRASSAVAMLQQTSVEAEKSGLRYLAASASTYLGEAYLNSRQTFRARGELQRALAAGDRMDLKFVQLRAHYLLMRAQPDHSESARHKEQARKLLEEIHKDAGTDDIYKRADIAQISSGVAQ